MQGVIRSACQDADASIVLPSIRGSDPNRMGFPLNRESLRRMMNVNPMGQGLTFKSFIEGSAINYYRLDHLRAEAEALPVWENKRTNLRPLSTVSGGRS